MTMTFETKSGERFLLVSHTGPVQLDHQFVLLNRDVFRGLEEPALPLNKVVEWYEDHTEVEAELRESCLKQFGRFYTGERPSLKKYQRP